jgi:PST family polysaccharide transporter
VFTQASFLAATIYIANTLSPNDYALMGIGMILIGFLNLVTEFGLGDAIVQKKNVSHDNLVSVFWFALITGFLASLICYLFSTPIETFYHMPGVANIIKVLSGMLILKSVSIVPYKLIEKKMRLRVKAIVDTFSKLASILAAVALAYWGYGVWALVHAQIVYALSITVMSFIFEPFIPRLFMRFHEIRDMMGFGLRIIALRFTWYLRGSLDKIIGGKFLTNLNFGYYSFGFKLVFNIQTIVHNIMNIISVPLLSKIQDDDIAVNYNYLMLVKYASVFVLPIFLGGFILSEELIGLFFAEKWAPMIKVFKISCLLQILTVMNSINENLFIAVGKPQYSLRVNLLGLILFGSSFLLGVQWGITGLLKTWMIVLPIFSMAWNGFTLFKRKISVFAYFTNIKPAILGSIVMLSTIMALKEVHLSNVFMNGRIGMALHLLTLIIIGGLSYTAGTYVADKTIITSMLKQTDIQKA